MVLTTTQKTEQALLDSGATKNFINPWTIERLQLPTQKLQTQRTIFNIDGTLNKVGGITHKCQLKIQFNHTEKIVDFFITDLGQDRAVLGFPFLREFNPTINWETGMISPENRILVTPKRLWEHKWKIWHQDGRTSKNLIRKVTFAQQWAAKANKKKQHLKESGIPEKYLVHAKVFSEEEAKQLPPSRNEDMSINLKDGAPEQLDCKVYPLSTKELGVLRQALQEDLTKGYIRHGTSSFVSPIFFTPKKDGEELRMVIQWAQKPLQCLGVLNCVQFSAWQRENGA